MGCFFLKFPIRHAYSAAVGQIPTAAAVAPNEGGKKKNKHRRRTSSKSDAVVSNNDGQSSDPRAKQESHQRKMSRAETSAGELSAPTTTASSGNESSVSPQTVIEQQHRRHSQKQTRQNSQEIQRREESSQQPTTTATRERRKSLAKQRASEANLVRDDDQNDDAERARPAKSSATSRPRSNSERLANHEGGEARSRGTTTTTTTTSTKKGELTRQYASMVADYAPASERFGNESPPPPGRKNVTATDHNGDDDHDHGEDGDHNETSRRETKESCGSRARSSRRSSQAQRPFQTEAEVISDQVSERQTGADEGGPFSPPPESNSRQEREIRRRASRSQPPSRHSTGSHHEIQAIGGHEMPAEPSSGTTHQPRRAVSVSPSLASSVNIRHILENVADVEGPFQDPHLALKVSIEALEGPCWSTKVEGMLALIRLASYHQQLVLGHLHEIVSHTTNETRNLRSTVARSAIFTLGDLCAKLKRQVEPEVDQIVQALLNKSIENTAFIRDDIRKALSEMLEHLTQWRLANTLLHHGANHKNVHVRRMASQFVAQLVDRMGAAKCLVGARDISSQLIPAAARFAQDNSPHTRYYGRLILLKIMHHGAFERLLRKNLPPNLYRSTVGIIESVKRRGAGDPPSEN